MNAIVPRNTIEDIVRFRNEAIELFAAAHAKILEAQEAERAAIAIARRAYPSTAQNAYTEAHRIATGRALTPITVSPLDDYMAERRRVIDLNVWGWIVSHTDLEHLMDATAKKQLREQMSHIIETPTDPGTIITEEEMQNGMPPVSVENIEATLESFMLNADSIFRRGIAHAFSQLDRRFRSHDGFKVGSRIILTNCFNAYGSWNWGNDRRDLLIDIERTFAILDGKLAEIKKQDEENEKARKEHRPPAYFTKTIGAIDIARGGGLSPKQSYSETDYFRVRTFKNGNAHLWMIRDDLVEKVNRILADHYGEVLADGQTKEDDPLEKVKTTPARHFGFFPTPAKAAHEAVSRAGLNRSASESQLRILEPSAGTGNLARLCVDPDKSNISTWALDRYRFDAKVDCIEIQPHLADNLKAAGIFHKVYTADFLQVTPETTALYDRIVMNPPFDMERDIDHVVHALKFLKPDGRLVAIMSAGTEFRQTKKAKAFRELMTKMGADWHDLPANSFAEVGTNVNTGIIAVNKNGKPKGRWERPTWPEVG